MTTSLETVRVVCATELIYQMMRRFYTDCTEWDPVMASELTKVLDDRIIAASEALGNSTAAPDEDSEVMRAYNAATHWRDAYQRIKDEVVAIACSGAYLGCALIPVRKYKKKEAEDLASVYFLADSAIRWANQSKLCAKLANDIDILEIPREQGSSADHELPAYSGPKLAQHVLADLIRQLLLCSDSQWRPGEPPNQSTSAYYWGKNLNASRIASALTPEAPDDPSAQEDPRTARGHVADVLPLVQATGNAKARGEQVLPGIYRTIVWMTEAIAKKKQASADEWPPETVLLPDRDMALVRVDQLRDCLNNAKKHRLP